MKKILAVVISLTLSVVGYAPMASAASNVTLSKSSGLSFDGEKVTISIVDFPTKSGLYLFQCVQPSSGATVPDLRQCNGADQIWITASGRGSFLPTSPEISIRLVGKFSTFDCTVEKCALFVQFDRFAADDRSEDKVIPLSFQSATSGATPQSSPGSQSSAPLTQGIGAIRTSLRVGQALSLPVTSDKGIAVAYRVNSAKVCSLDGNRVKAKRAGSCLIDAYAAPSQGVAMFASQIQIKVLKAKRK